MGDEFNIDKVESLICTVQEAELSDISKIIKEMITIKNSKHKPGEKKKKPYNIVEKINLNNISKSVASKIKKYHIDSYDIVDEALKCISEYDISIKEDLYDYYWDVYMDILIELGIDDDDYEKIKENVDNIYMEILRKTNNQIFIGKKSDIPTNKKVTYIGAITSYVFYKCKFLIPIENLSY